ncbi:hypothetical protein K439DRAFT_1397233 [Ramaria rubella]|nr:hypothetical protein K439DRAFT_1397233 [Ramaria rubella]
MPHAPVGGSDEAIQLFYQDSGVPVLHDAQTPYTTLILVHGYMYNCHIFDRLAPLAKASHIRLVTLNRRGYAGSTPFSPEETSSLTPAPDVSDASLTTHYEAFLQKRGMELARFIAWFIDTEGIPKISDYSSDSDEKRLGRASGGISLMGWSLGNVTTIPLLAFADTFELELVSKLEGYLRKVVIYDLLYVIQGFPIPDGAYNPLFDPTIPPEQRHASFLIWLQSYFPHASPTSILDPAIPPLEHIKRGILEPCNSKGVTDVTPEDKLTTTEDVLLPGHGDSFSLFPHAAGVHRTLRLRALYGERNAVNPAVWPHVDVSYIWTTEGFWDIPMAMRTVKDEFAVLVESSDSEYPARRKVTFFELEGNHFAHYDDPLRTFDVIARALE